MSWRDALRQNRRDMLALAKPEMTAITDVLFEVREQTARSLAKFLKEHKGSEYQLHQHRVLLSELDDALNIVKKELPSDVYRDLKRGAKTTTTKAVKTTEAMIREGEKKFRGAATTLRIPVAKVLTRVDRTLIGRFQSKSDRYAGVVGDRIRRDLMVGVVKGESVDQMARRLMGPGEYERLKGKPTKMADKIADGQFFRNEADAQRLVRTELANAHTEAQLESLDEANEDDPGWKKQWDAANDLRVCRVCWNLNGEIVELHRNFSGGVKGPPIHPNDRCCVVPHRDGWPKNALNL